MVSLFFEGNSLKKCLILLTVTCLHFPTLFADGRSYVTLGGGSIFDCHSHRLGSCAQVEYLFPNPCTGLFRMIRPQAVLILPKFKSVFAGFGIGFEMKMLRHIVIAPSFMPGLYIKGSGRNLGYPIEFRSCFDLAYEWNCGWRLGVQVFHISNASLGRRNPGMNVHLLVLSIPLKR